MKKMQSWKRVLRALGVAAATLFAIVLALGPVAVLAASTVTTHAGNGIQGPVINGSGVGAQFQWPAEVARDSIGNVYVPDYGNHVIRKITPAGLVSTFAGTPGVAGWVDGPVATAKFNLPREVAVDGSDNIYVYDYNGGHLRKITPAGTVSTLFTWSSVWDQVGGLAADSSGNVYASLWTPARIAKVTPGGVATIMNGGTGGGSVDGPLATAEFALAGGLAVDSNFNVYVADIASHRIRKIDQSTGLVSTLAGSSPGYSDGPATAAQFYNPRGVAVDSSGNVYVADSGGNRIRKINQTTGMVSTLAGSGVSGFLDGPGALAQFNGPRGVAVYGPGNIVYVADPPNYRIRKIVDDDVPLAAIYQYAAKFVCGVMPAPNLGSKKPAVVARGAYFTAVNVHNPNAQPANFQKKFVIALPGEQQGGKISAFFPAALIADEAFEIDCPDIFAHLSVPSGTFIKGFVVLESPSELDVVAVYTAAATPTGTVVTMDVEPVLARKK